MKQEKSRLISIILVLVVIVMGWAIITKNESTQYNNTSTTSYTNQQNVMQLTSDIFTNGGNIPVQYTCNGVGTAIPLQILNAPKNAQSLALIVFDPDAPNGGFVHWVIWNINTNTIALAGNNLPSGAVQGFTGLNKPGFVPPCPPTGVHHYNFTLYALDDTLTIAASSTRVDLLSAMNGHIIDSTTLVGLYGKGN